MQATGRGKQFVIDHRALAVAVAIVALISVAGGTALRLTTTDGSETQSVAADARPSGLNPHRPTDRPKSITGVMQLDVDSRSDLDRAARLDQFYEAKMAHLEAIEAQASQRTTWTAFPGHAGFTAPSDAERRQPEMDRADYIEFVRLHSMLRTAN